MISFFLRELPYISRAWAQFELRKRARARPVSRPRGTPRNGDLSVLTKQAARRDRKCRQKVFGAFLEPLTCRKRRVRFLLGKAAFATPDEVGNRRRKSGCTLLRLHWSDFERARKHAECFGGKKDETNGVEISVGQGKSQHVPLALK